MHKDFTASFPGLLNSLIFCYSDNVASIEQNLKIQKEVLVTSFSEWEDVREEEKQPQKSENRRFVC